MGTAPGEPGAINPEQPGGGTQNLLAHQVAGTW